MQGSLDNWSIWEPKWVSVDVHEVNVIDHETEQEYIAYQGYLNLCLDEGTPGLDDMKCIVVGTNFFSSNPGWVAFWTYDSATKMFSDVVQSVSLINREGSVVEDTEFDQFISQMFVSGKNE